MVKRGCMFGTGNNLFLPQTLNRIGDRRFDYLETYSNKRYQQTNSADCHKHPPANMDAIGEIL